VVRWLQRGLGWVCEWACAPALPALDSLDVSYLGTIILEAVRLPLSDSHRARRRLMLL
jgi:hypothetical protein